jgi:hypothetical protein
MNMRDRVSVLDVGSPVRRPAGEKVMQTFRMPRELVAFLRTEGLRSRRDLTWQVLRVLEGFRSHFGLPDAAAALLEADRKRLGMERFEYVLHVLYARTLAVGANGAGFDAPARAERAPAEELPDRFARDAAASP